MKIDLKEMSDDELLELSRNIAELRAERELKDMPKYVFSRDKDLINLTATWFVDDIDEATKGELVFNFISPALYKLSDYITGNYDLRCNKKDDKQHVVSTNSVKAAKVKRYREVHDALVNCLIDLTKDELRLTLEDGDDKNRP